MASNILQQDTTGVGSRQIDNCAAAHASGDLCYEQGYYGIAADDVNATGSVRMYLRVLVRLTVPSGTTAGQRLYGPSKPTGPITVANSSGGGNTVPLGIAATAADANNTAKVQLEPGLSIGL